jgi:hypothetical protein
MNRYTKKVNDKYVIDNEYYEEAVNKLAKFEDIIDELLIKQEDISKELETLRKNEKTKSYKFRDSLGHKLINTSLITIFKSHDLM